MCIVLIMPAKVSFGIILKFKCYYFMLYLVDVYGNHIYKLIHSVWVIVFYKVALLLLVTLPRITQSS